MIRKVAAAIAASVLATAASATEEEEESAAAFTLKNALENEDAFEFSTGVPDSPALAIAGLNVADVTQINDLRKFVVTLPTLLGDGDPAAIALDVNLAEVLFPIDDSYNTLSDYSAVGQFERILRRTRFSALARKGVENADDPSKSQRSLLAFGVAASLLDSSDPLLALFDKGNDGFGRCIDIVETEIEAYLTSDPYLPGFAVTAPPIKAALDVAAGKLDLAVDAIESGQSRDYVLDLLEAALTSLDDARALAAQVSDDKALKTKSSLSAAERAELAQLNDDDLKAATDKLLDEAKALRYEFDASFVKIPKTPASLVTKLDLCRKVVDDEVKFNANLDVGAGILQRGSTSAFDSFKGGGKALWASMRYPIRPCESPQRVFNRAMSETNSDDLADEARYSALAACSEHSSYFVLGAAGRVGFGEFVATGDATTPDGKANTIQAWGGAEYFSEKFRLAGKFGYADTNYKDPLLETFSSHGKRWLTSADFNVVSNLWVGVSYGKAQGTIEALEGRIFQITLRFAEEGSLKLPSLLAAKAN